MEFSFKCEFVFDCNNHVLLYFYYFTVVNYLLDLQNYAEGIYNYSVYMYNVVVDKNMIYMVLWRSMTLRVENLTQWHWKLRN